MLKWKLYFTGDIYIFDLPEPFFIGAKSLVISAHSPYSDCDKEYNFIGIYDYSSITMTLFQHFNSVFCVFALNK